MGRTFERRDRQRRARHQKPIATDLKRLDEHVVQPGEYHDAPELTDAQLAAADVFDDDDDDVRSQLPPSRLWKGRRSDDTD